MSRLKPKLRDAARQEEGKAEGKMPLLSHLLALRKLLVICAVAILAALLLIFEFAINYLMDFITKPIVDKGIEVIYTAVSEAFTTKFKVALIAAIVLVSPVIIWQIWKFIRPALYRDEKRLFKLLLFASLTLFLLGVVFCYTSVYFLALDFFMVSGENLATPMLSLDKYVGFLFGFIVPFGVAFMLPVFLYVTTKMGWTTPEILQSKRKYVILGIFFFAAILTPPDVISQVMLGVPMLLLYEVGILVSKSVKPKDRETEPAETPEPEKTEP